MMLPLVTRMVMVPVAWLLRSPAAVAPAPIGGWGDSGGSGGAMPEGPARAAGVGRAVSWCPDLLTGMGQSDTWMLPDVAAASRWASVACGKARRTLPLVRP